VRFKDGGETVGEIPYQVARDEVESNVTMLAEDQRSELAKSFGVRFDGTEIGDADAAEAAVAETAPRREPLWGVLLSALVVLLVAELFLANLIARQRQGYEVSAG
jgi:hypothetical protein